MRRWPDLPLSRRDRCFAYRRRCQRSYSRLTWSRNLPKENVTGKHQISQYHAHSKPSLKHFSVNRCNGGSWISQTGSENLSFGKIIAENCMKMKKKKRNLDQGRIPGATSPDPPMRCYNSASLSFTEITLTQKVNIEHQLYFQLQLSVS